MHDTAVAQVGEWERTGRRFRVYAPLELSKRLPFLNLAAAVVATTLKNANASLVYSFLYKIVEVGSGLLLAASSVRPPVLPASFEIHPT